MAPSKEPPVLTGVCYMMDALVFWGSEDPDTTIANLPNKPPDRRLDDLYPLDTPTFRLFYMHELCWQMLFNVVAGGQVSRRPHVVQCLYEVLSSEDYQAYLDRQPKAPRKWTNPLRDTVEIIDPRLPRLAFNNRPRRPWPDSAAKTLIQPVMRLSQSADIFSRLPTEILHQILLVLDTGSVCSLRLSSRTIAVVSSPLAMLPQAFWRSRFEPGHEMAFYYAGAMPIGDARPKNWFDLYRRIGGTLDDKLLWSPRWTKIQDPRLANSALQWHMRRQIWEAIQPAVKCLAAAVEGTSIQMGNMGFGREHEPKSTVLWRTFIMPNIVNIHGRYGARTFVTN